MNLDFFLSWKCPFHPILGFKGEMQRLIVECRLRTTYSVSMYVCMYVWMDGWMYVWMWNINYGGTPMRNRKTACFEALVLEPHIAQILRPLLATLLPPWWLRCKGLKVAAHVLVEKKAPPPFTFQYFVGKVKKSYRRYEFRAGFQANSVTWFLCAFYSSVVSVASG